MSYEKMLMTTCYIAAGISVLMAILALVIFLKLGIINVIGDLTGATARKAIEDIREHNSATGNKAHKPSPVNKSRGRVTDKMTPSGNLHKRGETLKVSVGTAKFKTSELSNDTTVLTSDNYTVQSASDVSNETTVLSNETTVLSNETTVLGALAGIAESLAYDYTYSFESQVGSGEFIIEEDITFIHTNERIV